MLEQDKAIRQRFRDCLTPMAAFANLDRLNALIGVHHVNSSTWLLNFMLDKLRESAYAENIGEAIVLCHVLPNGHNLVPELVEFLHKAPGNYMAAVIKSYMTRWRENDRIDNFQWFSALLLDLLAKPNWAEIGSEGIRQVAWTIYRNQTHQRMPLGAAISSQYASLLRFLILPWHQRPIEMRFRSGNLHLLAHNYEPALTEARSGLDPNALIGETPLAYFASSSLPCFTQTARPPSRIATS